MVDDFLVQSDKIGSANFYWSFPSKDQNDKLNLKASLVHQEAAYAVKNTELQRKIDERRAKTSRPNRKELIEKYNTLLSEDKELTKKLDDNKMNDPEEVKRIERQIQVVVEGANRWTDNIWALKKYLTKKKGLSSKEADKMLQIDSNFDYVSADLPSSKKFKSGK